MKVNISLTKLKLTYKYTQTMHNLKQFPFHFRFHIINQNTVVLFHFLSNQIMKRSFPKSTELDNNLTMANCLMLLSRGSDFDTMNRFNMTAESRVFECKTCNRQFSSFQALGGHRASHKKPRLIDGSGGDSQSSVKPKTHECSICGLEFAIGQALGGHMRRHRAASSHENEKIPALSISERGPVVKKANSRRVLCLDLNLTPYENDLEFYRLGRKATATTTMVDCFL